MAVTMSPLLTEMETNSKLSAKCNHCNGEGKIIKKFGKNPFKDCNFCGGVGFSIIGEVGYRNKRILK